MSSTGSHETDPPREPSGPLPLVAEFLRSSPCDIRKFGPDLQRIANRKLLILDAAENINDLRVPPGNRLEQLQGGRKRQHSIRINDQWRICFSWTSAGPADVEITDYH